MYSWFFAVVLAILIYFIVSLVSFCSQKKEEQVHPAMRNSAQSKKWLLHLVVSSVLLGVVFLIGVSVVVTFLSAIRFM